MERKLTINDIAMYLPFELMAICDKPVYKQSEAERTGIINYWNDNDIEDISISNGDGYYLSEISYIKPILRPISDLSKEIEVDGKKIVPIIELGFNSNIENYNSIVFVIESKSIPYSEIIKLHQWHFDTGGLIDAGLAIDINSIIS